MLFAWHRISIMLLCLSLLGMPLQAAETLTDSLEPLLVLEEETAFTDALRAFTDARIDRINAIFYALRYDRSLTPEAQPLRLSGEVGGPEGMAFTADGRFLYVCDHIVGGLFVIDVGDGTLHLSTPGRIDLPGKQIDVVRMDIAVIPNEGSALLRIAPE